MTKQVIRYRLTLQSPLILSIPGGDPNSADTLSFISGNSILGTLAHRWLQLFSCTGDPADNDQFQDLFLNGSVRYCHAYPEGSGQTRFMPVPHSLYTEKGQEETVYDLAHEEKEEILYNEDGNWRDLRPWRQDFTLFYGETVKYRKPERETRIHHQRDRERGRATEDSGEIFSYVSIARDERFKGLILLEDEKYISTLQDLLTREPLSLGRSRAAQYGGKAIANILDVQDGTAFIEAGTGGPPSNRRCVITLLSDYLGIDSNGHYSPDSRVFLDEFAAKAGLSSYDNQEKYVRTRLVSGYVSKWRMPRPVRRAISAGSVFVINVSGKMDNNKIQEVLWNGLGDRRSQGFGRIALNWHGTGDENGHYTSTEDRLINLTPPPPGTFQNVETRELLSLCRSRLLQNDMDDHLIEATRCLLDSPGSIPTKATLGRLRGRLRSAEKAQDIHVFLEHCESKPAGKQFQKCRIGNQSLFDWLNNFFRNPNYLGALLGIDQIVKKCYLDDENLTRNAFNSKVWDYQKRMAELVLRELTRINKEREKEGGKGHE